MIKNRKIAAVITEFNPYHNGHSFLLRSIREKTGADVVFALMSGDFVQRGEPAVYDKYVRAEMALKDGFDAVFELPVYSALGSSGEFAEGAVRLLNESRVTDYLCFGVEKMEPELFQTLSSILTEEPLSYQTFLRQGLSRGLSFPLARSLALEQVCGCQLGDFLSCPNNILALDYLTQLQKTHSTIRPVMIQREPRYVSAHRLRASLKRGLSIQHEVPETVEQLCSQTPGFFQKSESLSPLLTAFLYPVVRRYQKSSAQIWDFSPELKNRLVKAPDYLTAEELVSFLKTRNTTLTHIRRCLLHLMMDIRKEDHTVMPRYFNLLGMRTSASFLIREIRDQSDLPLITRKSDYFPATRSAAVSWKTDCEAADLYHEILFLHHGICLPAELATTIRIITSDT